MAFESGNKMEKSVFAILLLCLPGLLSAICSNPPPPPQYIGDPNIFNPDVAHDAFDTSNHFTPDSEAKGEDCKNGWCGDDGSCVCNPCFAGPTCQEYVDRFAPRFLAEEPFFIVDASASGSGGYSTFLDPAFDPIYPPFVYSSSLSTDFVDPAPSSSLPPTHSWTTSAATTPSQQFFPYVPNQYHQNPSPLFRIESTDDDLGLTCQLGQIGPAATCPCATPRYKVVGATTTFPDPSSSSSSPDTDEGHDDKASAEDLKSVKYEQGRSSLKNKKLQNQSHDRNNNLFFADEETGDVFLHQGFKLQPSKHYFITLQVSALHVNNTGYKPWKDEVVATLYVRPSKSGGEKSLGNERDSKSQEHQHQLPTHNSLKEEAYHHHHDALPRWQEESKRENAKQTLGDNLANEMKSEDVSSDLYFDSNSREGNEAAVPPVQNNKGCVEKSKQTSSRRIMRNFKNKLPYPLRGEKPHYKFDDYQQHQHHNDLEDGGKVLLSGASPSAEEEEEEEGEAQKNIGKFVPSAPLFVDETFLHRWKRQSKLPALEDFELTLSRLTESITKERISFGEKIKMQLIIQVPFVDFVDFDVKILSSKEDPRFAILSAHVSSIGSGISFDKDQTNLAPILKPSRNISLYDSAVWHWRGVSRGKNEQSRNKGITIDFDIVPVGGASYSNVSRRNPLLQLSSLPTSSSLSESGSSSNQGQSQRTNVSSLGKMTKDFNTYLLPIRARLTFPPGEVPHQHPDQSNPEKISQHFFTLLLNSSSSPTPNGSASGHHVDKNLNIMQGNSPLNRVHGVRVGLEGPREIPQGEWKSYTVKVYLQQPTRFKLTIEQMEGNEIADQDSISVGDIRILKMGKNIATCTQLPEKGSFRVSCKKLSGGRKGDMCVLESTQLNLCPHKLEHYSNGELKTGQEHELFHLSEDDNDNSAKEDESEENAIIFEGIIYGLPQAAPGSQFVLRAHIQTTSDPTQSKGFLTPAIESEVTLSGKIIKRRAMSRGKGSKASWEKNEFLTEKRNGIAIMPNQNENEQKRSRRNVFGSSHLLTRRSRLSKPKNTRPHSSDQSHHRKMQDFRRA